MRPEIHLMLHHQERPVTMTDSERAVEGVRILIRAGLVDEAARIAHQGMPTAENLNLQGVIAERKRQWDMARRLYGRAIRINPSYEPARRNMQRQYELYTFGRSSIPMNLG